MLNKLQDLFDRNAAYKTMYVAAIMRCREKTELTRAAEWLDAQRSGAYQIQSPQAIFDSLERHGAVVRTLTVDGEPYAGTTRDLQSDESVSPQAKVEEFVQSTQEALAFAAQYCGTGPVEQLFAQKPEYVQGYVLVLDECQEPGKTTAQIQEALRAAGALPVDDRTGVERVHASYFTGALENVGALKWEAGRWVTTPIGLQVAV